MKYAFVLGRVYTLSIAELLHVLAQPNPAYGTADNKVAIDAASPEVLVIETEKPILTEPLLRRLGGMVKICRVVDELPKREHDSVNFALRHYFRPSTLKKEFFKEPKGKVQFGVSLYLLDPELAKRPPRPQPGEKPTNTVFGEPKRIGLTLKKVLTEAGISSRAVLPEFNGLQLASVVVTKNLLLQKGCELCLLVSKTKVYVCKTTAVQDFEDYGRRDYQRPVRDDKVGMIPPKVAQIMLNLSGAKPGDTILDPFCGVGTILQEGLLVGYKMLGSDMSKQAIHGAEVNLEWFRNRYRIAPGKYHLELSDAGDISKLLESHSVSAVVTESTLGPTYSDFPSPADIGRNHKELKKIYEACFADFAKFLRPGQRVVMCIPAYRDFRGQYTFFPSLDFIEKLGYHVRSLVPREVAARLPFLKLTERGSAVYDRKDQIVAREIVAFEFTKGQT